MSTSGWSGGAAYRFLIEMESSGMIARYSKVALLAFAVFTTATAGEAAYDCTASQAKPLEESFGDYSAEIRTVVENRTKNRAWQVKIYRNNNLKKTIDLSNENRYARITMNVGDAKKSEEVNVKINFHPLYADADDISCEYKIEYDTDDESATWSLPGGQDSVCGDVTDLCEDCALTCENKFVSGGPAKAFSPNRWTTTVAICDSLDKNCAVAAK
jgi:hypothetical protein